MPAVSCLSAAEAFLFFSQLGSNPGSSGFGFDPGETQHPELMGAEGYETRSGVLSMFVRREVVLSPGT